MTPSLKVFVQSLFVLAVLACQPIVHASDKAKEARWAKAVGEDVMVGDAVWLTAGKDRFLGLYTEASGTPRGAAIILHGIGAHPDWVDVVAPLRSELPERGWTTLSIQMPILRNEAKPEEYYPLFVEVPPRINAAITYLQAKGYRDIVLVGHSMGSRMGLYYLSEDKQAAHNIKAMVALGLSILSKNPPKEFEMGRMISRLPVPMLDVHGTEDTISMPSMKQRVAMGKGQKYYQHMILKGPDHFFRDKNPLLLDTVSEWIAPHGKGDK